MSYEFFMNTMLGVCIVYSIVVHACMVGLKNRLQASEKKWNAVFGPKVADRSWMKPGKLNAVRTPIILPIAPDAEDR